MAHKHDLLRGIVFKQGDVWIAQCLEIDHAAQAADPQAAIKECVEGLLEDIKFAVDHGTFHDLKPAPMEFWQQ